MCNFTFRVLENIFLSLSHLTYEKYVIYLGHNDDDYDNINIGDDNNNNCNGNCNKGCPSLSSRTGARQLINRRLTGYHQSINLQITAVQV